MAKARAPWVSANRAAAASWTVDGLERFGQAPAQLAFPLPDTALICSEINIWMIRSDAAGDGFLRDEHDVFKRLCFHGAAV